MAAKACGREIYEYKKTHTWPEVEEHFGENLEALRKRERTYRKKNSLPPIGDIKSDTPPPKPTGKVVFTDKGYEAEAYVVSNRIRSLDDLLEATNADLSKWKIARYLANVWESGRKKKVVDLSWNNGVMDGFVDDSGGWDITQLWQIKVWFVPREEEPYEKALEDLIKTLGQHAPTYDTNKFKYKPNKDGYLLVPNLYDAHFGKRSQPAKNYTLLDAEKDFIKIAEAITKQASSNPKKPSRVLFPLGHDLLHIDTLRDTTTHGTWVEASADARLIINAVVRAVIPSIEAFATIAPVDVVAVGGNHDRLMVHWLAIVLDAFFKNHKYVTVRNDLEDRSYYQWGRVGLGLTHQAKTPQQLATLFPVEARQMWGDLEWTEWLTGHFHKERAALYAVDSVRGTVVRTISGLCDTDNYHSLHLFVGQHRAAEVLYYHKENGPAGTFPVFVSEL